MACSLLDGCPTFQASVTASAAIVKPLGVDLLAEFRREKGWQGASLGALGLLSIQIGLVDTLKQDYGVTPDGMLGHSAGQHLDSAMQPLNLRTQYSSASHCPFTGFLLCS